MIDELHSFIGTERGAHLRSLICRLGGQEPGARPPRGTLGDARPRDRRGSPLAAAISARVRAHHRRHREEVHPVKDLGVSEASRSQEPDRGRSTRTTSEVPLEGDLEKDVFDTFHGKTALIFANAKSYIEKFADYARRESARRGLPDLFRVHHGSLSKGEREETEEALKSAQPTATFCSSTLEMGIDVGNVKLVGQIGPPGR